MPTYSYPPFPSTGGAITNFAIALLEWIIEVPLVALANFITGIGGAVTTGSESSATKITGFIGQTWANSVLAFEPYGIIAPLLAALIWGAAIVVLVFFIFKAVQLGIRETEED